MLIGYFSYVKMDGVYKKYSLDNVKKSEVWMLPPDAPERYILSIIRLLHRAEEESLSK